MLAVQPGDRVERYQVLARPEEDGSPVYAPCAGSLEEIVERRIPGLGKTPCALLSIDAQAWDAAAPRNRRTGRFTAEKGVQIMEKDKEMPDTLPLRRLVGIAKRAAIVDEQDGQRLWKKLEALEGRLPPYAVYADAIDDQPYMSASLAVLVSFGKEVAGALRLLCGALSARGGVLARWDKESSGLLGEEYEGFPVTYVQGKYPSSPAVDVYMDTLQSVRFGVGALLALARAVGDGRPQTTQVVTVAGDGVQMPLNLEAPLGMSVEDLLTQCGASGVIHRVVAGGLMAGRIVGPASPVSPCLIALTAQAAPNDPPRTSCVGCGRCASVCPAGLAPFHLYQKAKKSTPDQLKALGGDACLECGCCSYVCPAGLPLAASARWVRRNLEALERKGQAAGDRGNLKRLADRTEQEEKEAVKNGQGK